jgi:GMP synthase (glutamine-hydrolysing)
VQGDARTYSFAAAISSNDDKPNWNELFILARMITKACHHINRVVYILVIIKVYRSSHYIYF